MNNSNLPPIYDLRSLRATKVYLKARSNTRKKELDERWYKIRTLNGFLEKDEEHTLFHSVSDKAFNVFYNMLVNRTAVRFSYLKATLLRSQAQMLKKPLKLLFHRLSDWIMDIITSSKFMRGKL